MAATTIFSSTKCSTRAAHVRATTASNATCRRVSRTSTNTDPGNLDALEKRGQALAEGDRFDEVSSRLLEIQVRRRSPAA